jgi:hypothetical protein
MIYQWFGLKTTGTICPWFGLKTTGTVSSGLASKSVATISPNLASKPVVEGFLVWDSKLATQFSDLDIKITVTVSYLGLNQTGYGLSVTLQNHWEDEDGAGHALRSSGLLRLKLSRGRVFQSGLMIGGGVAWMVLVAS